MVFPTNKTDSRDINEILLKLALNTIHPLLLVIIGQLSTSTRQTFIAYFLNI